MKTKNKIPVMFGGLVKGHFTHEATWWLRNNGKANVREEGRLLLNMSILRQMSSYSINASKTIRTAKRISRESLR